MKLKREKCEYCGVKSLWKTIHKPNCEVILKYGYLEVKKVSTRSSKENLELRQENAEMRYELQNK
jgi:hypothetical protein